MKAVTLKWIADHVAPSAYAWAKSGRLKTFVRNGEKHVDGQTAAKLKRDLDRTVFLSECSRLTGIPTGSMRMYIDIKKVVKTIDVYGHERALRSCIPHARAVYRGEDKVPVRKTRLLSLFETCMLLDLELGEVYQLLVVKKKLKGKLLKHAWHVYEESAQEYKKSHKRRRKR